MPAYMVATFVGQTRYLFHGFALGVLLVSTLGFGIAMQRSIGGGRQAPVEAALARPTAPVPTSPEPLPTQPLPPRQKLFAPAVERWRPLSRDAVGVVDLVTGVRFDEDFLLALVAVESDGQPAAHSAGGAIGLAQVEPATFRDLRARYGNVLGNGALDQPRVNLVAGALYLAECVRSLAVDLDDPESVTLLLHAYNLGPRAVAQWKETGTWLRQEDGAAEVELGLPTETVEHAARILATFNAVHPLPWRAGQPTWITAGFSRKRVSRRTRGRRAQHVYAGR